MDEETKTAVLILQLVKALRHARPHVMAVEWPRFQEVIDEMDQALIAADEVIHWSDE